MPRPQAVYDAKVCDASGMVSRESHVMGNKDQFLFLNYCSKTSLWPKRVLRGRMDLRNLVSMSSKDELAQVLRDSGVFVLPLSRRKWALSHGSGYHKLEDLGDPEKFRSTLPIRLTTTSYGKREGGFLSNAYNSGLLSHFSGAQTIYATDPGRGSAMPFSFHVDGYPELQQDGAQMEIDQLYEGPTDVLVFEAKVGWRETFLIRQLYYPYRSHRIFQETAARKVVRPFFFIADPEEETYSLWEYAWTDDLDYEALRLKRARRFRIVEEELPKDLLMDIPPDPTVPFFQANDMNKVLELPFLVLQGVNNAKAWADHYGFALRQGSYYRAAAEALGLVKSEDGDYILTEAGKRFVKQSPTERNSAVAERLLRNSILNAVFDLAHKNGTNGVTDEDVARIIKEKTGLSGKTPARRASSVRRYFSWLSQTTATVVVEGRRIYTAAGWDKRAKGKASRSSSRALP